MIERYYLRRILMKNKMATMDLLVEASKERRPFGPFNFCVVCGKYLDKGYQWYICPKEKGMMSDCCYKFFAEKEDQLLEWITS